MKIRRVFTALAVSLCMDARAASPQPAASADERVDRIVGMAMARGGALAFLQRLTDYDRGPRDGQSRVQGDC